MTEGEWLTCKDPLKMHTFLVERTSGDRKWWLHAVACCRNARPELSDDRIKKAIEVAERYVDGLAPESEWRSARRAAEVVIINPATSTDTDAAEAAAWAAGYGSTAIAVEGEIQCRFFRDIFGTPFRPVGFSPSWRTDTAVSIARQMYDACDFGAMPILADALQDAGCEHPDILDHCRGSGPHVRGCWVVDLVLGIE